MDGSGIDCGIRAERTRGGQEDTLGGVVALEQSLVLPAAFEVDSFSSVILSPKPFCKKSSHEFPYDISALGWARPFHQIFEKGPNLVFDGRRGDRLRFYDCLPSQPLQTLSENAPVVVAVATPTLSFLSLRVSIYMTSGRYEVHLFCRGSPGQLRSSGLRAWEQLKQRRVWSGLNSGPARPSAARSGNGARRGRRYAPLLRCDRPPDYVKESRPGGLLPPSQLRIRSRGARKPWADRPGLSLLFCSRHDKGARKRYAQRAEDPLRVSVVSCAPLSSSAPPGSLGCWPNKHLPAAPAARLTGGALVILTVLSAGAPLIALAISYGSSSSQPQGPALRGQSGLSDLERYYESSVPDSIAAAIWFTGTTKKSHAYVTVIDGFIILDYEGPGRASGFHSHHHIDDKSPRALP
ncbi:hypothetical protein V6N12_076091 [Hibiscus sabdariffa]|uniref:Uncharacterized protein n=1 Tax=Hibiscus sabdariffa TaxID=183260 RepID=A0ABR2AY83_9ROSI